MRATRALVGLALLVTLPSSLSVDAQAPPNPQICAPSFNLAQVTGNLAAGPVNFCVTGTWVVAHANSVWTLSATVNGPALLGTSTPSVQILYPSVSGCTIGTPQSAGNTFSAGFGIQVNFYVAVTMTSDDCHGVVQAQITPASGSTVYNQILAFNTRSNDALTNHFEYQCAALAVAPRSFTQAGSTCNTLTANIATTGALTLSGTLGAQHLVIDQWPSLTAAVANSGTVNVVNSGGQAFSLTCPSAGCPLLNVQNSGGQTVAVSSLPQLQVAITSLPTLNIAQAGAAWALTLPTGLHITVDGGTLNAILNGTIRTDSQTTLVGNSSTVLHFPETLHLCGTPGPNGTCQPIQSTNAAYLTQTATVLGTMAWLVWIVAAAASRFLKRAMLRTLADLATFAILALPMDPAQWQLLFLANAALFLYDMMAVMAGD